jgi:hypothetical protein
MSKLVSESLVEFINEDFIKFGRTTQNLQEEFPIFKKLSTALILRALQQVNRAHFTNNKLDLDKFYYFLKGPGSMYKYTGSYQEMKNTLMDIAPVLNIIDQIKFSREEKSNLKMQKKAIEGGIDMSYFDDAEIPESMRTEEDYAVRNQYRDSEPAFYRFDKKLTPHERNMLRVSYAFNHGNPEKTIWQNYLEAVPVNVGFAEKNNRSLYQTKDPDVFRGETYD